jgi:hypothetical protein
MHDMTIIITYDEIDTEIVVVCLSPSFGDEGTDIYATSSVPNYKLFWYFLVDISILLIRRKMNISEKSKRLTYNL